MNARTPAYFVQTITPSGAPFMGEDSACADFDAAVNEASEAIAQGWPMVRVWAVSTEAPMRDVTALVLRAVAALYEARGYVYDTIPNALIDYASDAMQAAHDADQAAQLRTDWRREVAA